MSFKIRTINDVFKFALPLYDYLSQNGHSLEAEALASLVDSCLPTDALAVEAHRKAFRQIQNSVKNLPSEYRHALDDSLIVLQPI